MERFSTVCYLTSCIRDDGQRPGLQILSREVLFKMQFPSDEFERMLPLKKTGNTSNDL